MEFTRPIAIFFTITFSSLGFAISSDELGMKCLEVGKAKIAEQAKVLGCSVDLNKVEVQGVDIRWYNPSKYVWYQLDSKCNDSEKIVKLVQYSNGKCDGVEEKKGLSVSDVELGKKCLEIGKAKIAEQAKAYGCSVDLSKVEIQEVDNRWYNPSKYIWYQAKEDCSNSDKIVALVQFTKGKCISNGSVANVSLKNAVQGAVKSSEKINTHQDQDALKISDKARNGDVKTLPLDDSSTSDKKTSTLSK